MTDRASVSDRYQELLGRYFEKEEEKALFEVSELAKELVSSKLGPDILLDIHNQCLRKMIEGLDPMTIGKIVVNANELLLNGIMAYAMNYYNFMDLLEVQRKELENANIRLKELDRLKSMFIASMSHELRTPLNSIIGFSSILLKEWVGPINAEQKENLSIILRSGKHLLSLINDVIDISKVEAGLVELKREDFNLYDVLTESVTSIAEELKAKGLELKMIPIHQTMHTDRRRLLQCLLNLLSNAVKFTEKGSVQVRACLARDEGRRTIDESTSRLSEAVAHHSSSVIITVEDTGIGIKEEDISKLFQPFVRLESPLKSKVLGTGLGLYLTKKIITEILKGEIEAESKYGRGSIFRMKIPVKI